MRKEALLEQWKQLYEAATRIKELKPWEKLWDMDLIAVRSGAKEDTVFYSILGRGGDCYGIAVYEGYEGLNSFLMLPMQQSMNLKPEYAMFNQKNLTCYWGNREELTGKQRKLIKDLILNMGICFYFHLEKTKRHGILVRHLYHLHHFNLAICLSQMRNCFQTLRKLLNVMPF